MKIRSVIITLVFLFRPFFSARNDGLYKHDGPVIVMESETFSQITFNKSYGLLVAFYASWCGHCHRFAPIWTRFAEDIKAWEHLIRPAAIDCAQQNNQELCKVYKINAFPSLKFFPPQSNNETEAQPMSAAMDVVRLVGSAIDLVQTILPPDGAQKLQPLTDDSEVDEALKRRHPLAPFTGLVGVVAENSSSNVGRELVLDFYRTDNVEIFRYVVPDNDTASQFPSLYIRTNGRQLEKVKLQDVADGSRHTFRDLINLRLGLEVTPTSDVHPEKTKQPPAPLAEEATRAHRRDIDSALTQVLAYEVAQPTDLSDSALAALKELITVLINYYPANAPLRALLEALSAWLAQKTALSGREWSEHLGAIQTENAHLPNEVFDQNDSAGGRWAACQGSTPAFRGYPCALWTMFHVLATEAYLKGLQNPNKYNARHVTDAVVSYVTNFFTCRDCAENFQRETADMKVKAVTSRDALLYLWRVHNAVNKRLHGDVSEDPAAPKVEFPSVHQCAKCRTNDRASAFESQWDVVEVGRFLVDFYSAKRLNGDDEDATALSFNASRRADLQRAREARMIRKRDIESRIRELYNRKLNSPDLSANLRQMRELEYETRIISETKLLQNNFSGTDVSLCVGFYLLCVILIIVVYMRITLRKGKNGKGFLLW